jgi:Glycosyltransferase family 87
MNPRRALLVVLVAAALRLALVFLCDREVADVLRYRKVADHVLSVSWNPYQAPRLHPYPPVWFAWEAASGWLARQGALPFAVLVKLPQVMAELALVALLARGALAWPGGQGTLGLRAAWVYALHPVSLLVTAAHGQFDALALLFVMLALSWSAQDRHDRSALALSAAVALKSFPALLLPLFLLGRGRTGAARYALLCLGPLALLLLPFALHDPGALWRELPGYGGVADFGWIGLWRGLAWLRHGVLPRAEAAAWGGLVLASKLLFLAAYAALLAALARGRLRLGLGDAALLVLLTFLVCYGALSAQYLLWVVPLGLARLDRELAVYSVLATLALLGFYPFLAPGVLFPRGAVPVRFACGALWVVGTGSVLLASAAWLGAVLRRGSRA